MAAEAAIHAFIACSSAGKAWMPAYPGMTA